MSKNFFSAFILSALVGIFISSCGNSNPQTAQTTNNSPATAATNTPPAAAVPVSGSDYDDPVSYKVPEAPDSGEEKSAQEIADEKEFYSQRSYPELSTKAYSKYDVDGYMGGELRLMRNEIYAAHGYIFKSADLKEYFAKMTWYKPQFDNVDNKLTDIEKTNIQILKAAEKTATPGFGR